MRETAKSSESREVPGYLKRYQERTSGARDGVRESLYLRRFRPEPSPKETGRGSRRRVIEVHLIRHGQTQGYTIDGGLTPLGTWQARRRGAAISEEVRVGENVAVVAARTSRALRTAQGVIQGLADGLAALEKGATVVGPELADELQNFLVRLPSGVKDPTVAARARQVEVERLKRSGGPPPPWVEEVGRFWDRQQSGADPIEYWLRFPLACFEPPASVVRRYWAGLIRLAGEHKGVDRLVCAVHSGPIRAFATTAIGLDLGEPHNTEEVRVRLRRDLSEAEVSYRGHARKMAVPPVAGYTGWAGQERMEEPGVESHGKNGSRDGEGRGKG